MIERKNGWLDKPQYRGLTGNRRLLLATRDITWAVENATVPLTPAMRDALEHFIAAADKARQR